MCQLRMDAVLLEEEEEEKEEEGGRQDGGAGERINGVGLAQKDTWLGWIRP